MADVESDLKNWSVSPTSNKPTGATTIGTGLDDNLREIQAVVRQQFATDTLASASTVDLSTVSTRNVIVTGTTTITAFGTLDAGIERILFFSDSLTITHNATSLICPGDVDISTQANTVVSMRSAGGGNWIVTNVENAATVGLGGSIAEKRLDLGTGATETIDAANGTMQYKSLAENCAFTLSFGDGESVYLHLVNASTYFVTWSTAITWTRADSQPSLTNDCAVVLWKENGTYYGTYVGTFV